MVLIGHVAKTLQLVHLPYFVTYLPWRYDEYVRQQQNGCRDRSPEEDERVLGGCWFEEQEENLLV